jgi:hypothetical protein
MPLKAEHLNVLWPLFPLLIATSLWLGVKAGGDNLLKNKTAAPSGMGSLERAGSLDEARKVMESWNREVPEGRTQAEIEDQSTFSRLLSNDGRKLTEVAKRSLVFDLCFIVLYTTSLAVACLLAATEIAVRRRKQKQFSLVKLGIYLAGSQILTAAFDLFEDLALWRMLKNSSSEIWPLLAYGCSIAKYAVIAISLAYILTAFIFWLFEAKQRRAGAKPHPVRA